MNGPDRYPDVERTIAERNELMRIAAQSALDRSNGGRSLDPEARRWALHWAAIEPLGRPLSSGAPETSRV